MEHSRCMSPVLSTNSLCNCILCVSGSRGQHAEAAQARAHLQQTLRRRRRHTVAQQTMAEVSAFPACMLPVAYKREAAPLNQCCDMPSLCAAASCHAGARKVFHSASMHPSTDSRSSPTGHRAHRAPARTGAACGRPAQTRLSLPDSRHTRMTTTVTSPPGAGVLHCASRQ